MKKIITIVICALSINAFAQVPTSWLVGYWPFNGNANDATGYGNNGTVTGASLTIDRFGTPQTAYSFNGVSDKIVINSPNLNLSINPLSDNYSIMFWVKSSDPCLTGLGARIMEYVDGVNTGGYPFSFQVNPNDNNVRAYLYDGTNNPFITYTNVFDDTWKMLTMVVDNQKDSIYGYVNNILSQQIFNTLTLPFQAETMIVIGNRFSNDRPYSGLIDDIRIYKRVLSSNEISTLFNESLCYQTVTVTDTLIINANLNGFNPVTYQNTIKVYPNPTLDHITIDYGNYATLTGYILKITNSLSQVVFTSPINQQQSYVDLNTWSGNGIYFVHLIDPQGNTLDIRKIVLQ